MLFAAASVALYQGFRGGFEHINQQRQEADKDQLRVPIWLYAILFISAGLLLAAFGFLWLNYVWLIATALSMSLILLSVSLKMLLVPRNDNSLYQKVFVTKP